MDPDLLAAREMALLQRLEAGPDELVRGEQKGAIQEEFGDIYTAYLAVIRQESQPLEALKRAIFLQWYAFIEPYHITGAGELDGTDQRGVMEAFERALEEGWADEEAQYMVHWYNSITCWYFDAFRSLPRLAQLLTEDHPAIDLTAHMSTGTLSSRGMMGDYFDDMVHGQREHGVFWDGR